MLTPEQIQINWNTLTNYCSTNISQPLADSLHFYQHDFVDSLGTHVLGFMNAPAGKGMHHAYQGGLVQHILEMLDFYTTMGFTLTEGDAYALRMGIVLHDFHKGYLHFKLDTGLDYYSHVTTHLMKPNQKTWYMLSGEVVDSPIVRTNWLIRNIVESSEGGWAENAPRETSVVAKLAYIFDEMSVCKNRLEYDKRYTMRTQDKAFYSLL